MDPQLRAHVPRRRLSRASGRRGLENLLNRCGLGPVAGVDEAGRGACCGPLTVAAVILPRRLPASLSGLADSKRLSPARRDTLAERILDKAVATAILSISAGEVDALGVHRANLEGMRRALAALQVAPGFVLSDGFPLTVVATPSLGVMGGDDRAACVAAASILAKVHRDREMVLLDEQYPAYGLAGHKGYGTAAHQAALEKYGPCPHHRLSYANVAAAVAKLNGKAHP